MTYADTSTPREWHVVRRGSGRSLLLLHGIGGSWQSWLPVLDALAEQREVIAVDLPGFGDTPPLPGTLTFARLVDATVEFLEDNDLVGVDLVGSSMGARMVLELARRGVAGAVVSLDPGGFWQGWERTFFGTTIAASIRLIRAMQPVMPVITANVALRTAMFAQLSPRPWNLSPTVLLTEMRSYARSPSFDDLLADLVRSPMQEGVARGVLRKPMTIGWGRSDRVTLPQQALRAVAAFPDARLHWFERAGHLPMWDVPAETVRVILDTTS